MESTPAREAWQGGGAGSCASRAREGRAQIEIIERATGKNLGSFGRPGTFPGKFNQVHGIAVDAPGNVYLEENRGRRVHKFKPASP